MLFFQIEFFVFFAVALTFLLAVKNNEGRKLFLLFASYYFYAHWDRYFVFLIVATTVIDYLVALGMGKTHSSAKRKFMLGISLVTNLGNLGFFKYYNFVASSLDPLIGPLGFHPRPLDLILPIGISFYTFQSLSYTIDVYRKKIEPCRSFLDVSLFVAFFPQLLCGPIVRASHFLPQLNKSGKLSWDNLAAGSTRFVQGFFKKVFVADRLAIFTDHFFANPGAFDSPTTWLGMAALSIQLYCDFSGYSDMAIGLARAMGYDLGENFNYPYLSRSMPDMWRRWNMSLSRWIRDYVYIPLGGSQKGELRTYRNLMITMTVFGLWHGAAWTFVCWGAVHGLVLVLTRVWRNKTRSEASHGTVSPGQACFWWLLTMVYWIPVTVLSRATSFTDAALIVRQMFLPEPGISWMNPFALLAVAGMVVVHLVKISRFEQVLDLPMHHPWTPVTLITLVLLSIIFFPMEFRPFFYFQF